MNQKEFRERLKALITEALDDLHPFHISYELLIQIKILAETARLVQKRDMN